VSTLIKKTDGEQSLRYAQGSAAARFARRTLRIPHATHPLPLSFEKERGDTKVVLFNCSPSLTLLERGNKRG